MTIALKTPYDVAVAADLFSGEAEREIRSSRLLDFEKIRQRRDFERRYLPFLKNGVDLDICCEIGFHQLGGSPLTVKQLLLLKLAPAVTVFRRLEHLSRLDVITRVRSQRDRRVHELRLTPGALRLFASYAALHSRTG